MWSLLSNDMPVPAPAAPVIDRYLGAMRVGFAVGLLKSRFVRAVFRSDDDLRPSERAMLPEPGRAASILFENRRGPVEVVHYDKADLVLLRSCSELVHGTQLLRSC